MKLRLVFALPLLVAACGDDEGASPDGGGGGPDAPASADAAPADAAPPDADPFMPQTLRETGLYADFDSEVLAAGVVEFRPAYELWSDGAEKRRWVYLPEGSTIDTSDMDFWAYPVGTKLWKEFVSGETRVETRLLYKTGPARTDWYMMAYAWNEAQTEAVAVPDGVVDALGTQHDIPEQADCRRCHNKVADISLGFTALQLDHELGGGVTLASLIADGRLSDPPSGSTPYFPLPGDATARAALGYLHGNCGGCHHADSEVQDNVKVILRLMIADLAAAEAAGGDLTKLTLYSSSVGVPNELNLDEVTHIVAPGNPAASAVHARMAARDLTQMPPFGTEVVDDQGMAAVDAWITALGD